MVVGQIAAAFNRDFAKCAPQRGSRLEIKPTDWLVRAMKTVGLYEAKTRLSELYSQVEDWSTAAPAGQ